MPKFTCTVKGTIYETYEYEVEEEIEIKAPDEVQAEDDAITAAENMPIDSWINNPSAKQNTIEYDSSFEVIDTEERENYD